MGTNDTTNWERRLKGEVVPLTSDMEPDYGFYRVRTKDKMSWRAIAYWFDDAGDLHCKLQGRDGELTRDQAQQAWPSASQNPITHDLYRDVTERGLPWPDLNDEVTRLHNNPPEEDSFENLQERIDDLSREAERLMKKGAAKSQEEADQAADVADSLAKLHRRADTLREIEKRPFWTRCLEIEAAWKPLLTAALIHKTLKQVVCAPWLASQKKAKEQAEAEARRKADEARRAALAAEAEARRKATEAAKTGNVAAAAEAERAQQKAEEITRTAVAAQHTAQAVARETVTAGTRGRGVHLRAADEFSIEDRAAMFAYLITNEKSLADIDAVFLKHAQTLHRAGIKVPGLKVTQGSQAA